MIKHLCMVVVVVGLLLGVAMGVAPLRKKIDRPSPDMSLLQWKTLRFSEQSLGQGAPTIVFSPPTLHGVKDKLAAQKKKAAQKAQGKPVNSKIEDCMGCRFVWSQVEMDVATTSKVEDVQASFEHNALQAQKSAVFWPVCEAMYDQMYAMADDYMSQYSVDEICCRAKLCKCPSEKQTCAQFWGTRRCPASWTHAPGVDSKVCKDALFGFDTCRSDCCVKPDPTCDEWHKGHQCSATQEPDADAASQRCAPGTCAGRCCKTKPLTCKDFTCPRDTHLRLPGKEKHPCADSVLCLKQCCQGTCMSWTGSCKDDTFTRLRTLTGCSGDACQTICCQKKKMTCQRFLVQPQNCDEGMVGRTDNPFFECGENKAKCKEQCCADTCKSWKGDCDSDRKRLMHTSVQCSGDECKRKCCAQTCKSWTGTCNAPGATKKATLDVCAGDPDCQAKCCPSKPYTCENWFADKSKGTNTCPVNTKKKMSALKNTVMCRGAACVTFCCEQDLTARFDVALHFRNGYSRYQLFDYWHPSTFDNKGKYQFEQYKLPYKLGKLRGDIQKLQELQIPVDSMAMTTFWLAGHASVAGGQNSRNVNLSRDRVHSVACYLKTILGAGAKFKFLIGFFGSSLQKEKGEMGPVADAKYRRVDIIMAGNKLGARMHPFPHKYHVKESYDSSNAADVVALDKLCKQPHGASPGGLMWHFRRGSGWEPGWIKPGQQEIDAHVPKIKWDPAEKSVVKK